MQQRTDKSNGPLLQQLEKDGQPKVKKQKIKQSKQQHQSQDEYLDTKTSNRILALVKEQQQEIKGDELNEGDDSDNETQGILDQHLTDDDESLNQSDYEDYAKHTSTYQTEIELDAHEQHLLNQFMTKEPLKQAHLSNLVMKNISSTTNSSQNPSQSKAQLNERIVDVYTKLGLLMSRYKSGKLPKAFKIIPSLPNWEDILYLTQPNEWTPNATYEATRMFVSNLKSKMAQSFLGLFLLDKVREDIASSKKLNYHLYMSIKKSLYKPAAFFKGFLLPLLETGNCTLKEAAIIGSVLVKVSVPMLHSAAALLKLSEMEYTGPNSVFIRILLDKKYALPYRVVDALVFHFISFKQDPREMPVLWHQSFLIFVQRYKEDLTPEQKDALLECIRFKVHYGITPDIRRELQNSVCRGDIVDSIMQM